MKLLFVKPSLVWPRSSGHDVHTFYMMQACALLGHEVGLATIAPALPEAVAGLPLAYHQTLTDALAPEAKGIRLSRLQERFRSYWGVDARKIGALSKAVRTFAPDAVVVVGLDALPFFGGIEGAARIWYAADEWIWHHLSLVRPTAPSTLVHVKTAAIKGLYERAYAPIIDRVWVVSESERRAMRWLAGFRHVDVVPNGVDATHFVPTTIAPQPRTAVFWGRLDFEPNIDALEWFCRQIWPVIRAAVPDARFTIIGFNPGGAVRALATLPGIELVPDLPDLRATVQQRAVVVLPFVSGGGIKNKLLEAAAMGLPIVCTPRALSGLCNAAGAGILAATTPQEWKAALTGLWGSDERRSAAGTAARNWVVASHSWRAGAEAAMQGVAETLHARTSRGGGEIT